MEAEGCDKGADEDGWSRQLTMSSLSSALSASCMYMKRQLFDTNADREVGLHCSLFKMMLFGPSIN